MTALRWTVAVSGWLALAATALPVPSAARVLVTAVFLLVCPGLAATLLCAGRLFTDRFGRATVLEAALVTGAVSLSLSALVAEALLLSHVFTTARALAALAALTSVMALASALPRTQPETRSHAVPGRDDRAWD
ncbi:hypothetical protein [Streptomyces sp. NPDC055749]